MADMELQGMDELINKLEDMGRRANTVMNSALKKGAKPILEDAKSNAPEKSGKGKEGLKVGRIRNLRGVKYVEIGITKGDISKIYYMKFHEFGTSKMRAKPFLGPALHKNKTEAHNIIANELKRGLRL